MDWLFGGLIVTGWPIAGQEPAIKSAFSGSLFAQPVLAPIAGVRTPTDVWHALD